MWNEKFYRALLALCLQAILFINSEATDFEEIIQGCEITPFEAWKLMENFLNFDPRLPVALRQKFKEIDMKFIAFIGW